MWVKIRPQNGEEDALINLDYTVRIYIETQNKRVSLKAHYDFEESIGVTLLTERVEEEQSPELIHEALKRLCDAIENGKALVDLTLLEDMRRNEIQAEEVSEEKAAPGSINALEKEIEERQRQRDRTRLDR